MLGQFVPMSGAITGLRLPLFYYYLLRTLKLKFIAILHHLQPLYHLETCVVTVQD